VAKRGVEVEHGPCIGARPARLERPRCTLLHMRTNIEIDDEVMNQARRVAGTRTKRETVDLALRELVARRRQRDILDLRGRISWEGDLEASRRGRSG